jgi:hypothetical protein
MKKDLINQQLIVKEIDSTEVKKQKLISCVCDFDATIFIRWDDNTISHIRFDEEQQKFFNGEYEFELGTPCDGLICVTRQLDTFNI